MVLLVQLLLLLLLLLRLRLLSSNALRSGSAVEGSSGGASAATHRAYGRHGTRLLIPKFSHVSDSVKPVNLRFLSHGID